ncbi:MAG: transcription elongation factor GreA [Candidatus Amesbacteria bacterium]|nr:transcription elongation factor GreA [Candidatus Amesbacteria bacterium]
MNNQILVTKTGLIKLKSELESLVSIKRPQLVERLSLARSMGDLSENSDYQDAKESLSFVDGQISELEDLMRIAKVTKPTNNSEVSFGHAVKVKVGKAEVVFEIVGEWEANPSQKKISHTSPLGKALLGKKIGEQVDVAAPAGKVVYTVMSIS